MTEQNTLHQAVAEAINDVQSSPEHHSWPPTVETTDRLAAVAVRVVLAEVAQSIERAALRADLSKYEPGLVVALAALAALGEQGTDA